MDSEWGATQGRHDVPDTVAEYSLPIEAPQTRPPTEFSARSVDRGAQGASSATNPAMPTESSRYALETPTRPYAKASAKGPAPHDSQPGASSPPTHSDPAWYDGEEEELQRFVTTRMAARTRDPKYRQVQKTLARRRSLRATIAEIMLSIDIALSVVALLVVSRYLEQVYKLLPHWLAEHLNNPGAVPPLLIVIVLLAWPVILSLSGLYSGSWANNLFAPAKAMRAVAVAGVIMSSLLYVFQLVQPRAFILSFIVADAALLAVSRIILRPLFMRVIPRRRVLVVGTGRLALDAARAVFARHAQGLEFIGVAGPEHDFKQQPDVQESWRSALFRSGAMWRLGGVQDVPDIVFRREVDVVIVALSPRERRSASRVISSLAHQPVRVFVLPDVIAETAKTSVESVDGIPMIGLTESAISGWTMRVKRLMDLVICVPIVLLSSPLLLGIALLVRMDSPGPALFKQERVGQHNRRFIMLKFRTMYMDADSRAKAVTVHTAQGLVHKQRNDPRITPIGAWLRRTSLDELPQLLNVIKGDMSLVGPRPELPWIVEHYRAWQYRRLLVPQGITGWWQVHGRSDRVLHLHTQDDIYYVRNYSLWLDIKILFMTIKTVFTGRGAF